MIQNLEPSSEDDMLVEWALAEVHRLRGVVPDGLIDRVITNPRRPLTGDDRQCLIAAIRQYRHGMLYDLLPFHLTWSQGELPASELGDVMFHWRNSAFSGATLSRRLGDLDPSRYDAMSTGSTRLTDHRHRCRSARASLCLNMRHARTLSRADELRVLLGLAVQPFVTALLAFISFPVVDYTDRYLHGGRPFDAVDAALALATGVGIAGLGLRQGAMPRWNPVGTVFAIAYGSFIGTASAAVFWWIAGRHVGVEGPASAG